MEDADGEASSVSVAGTAPKAVPLATSTSTSASSATPPAAATGPSASSSPPLSADKLQEASRLAAEKVRIEVEAATKRAREELSS